MPAVQGSRPEDLKAERKAKRLAAAKAKPVKAQPMDPKPILWGGAGGSAATVRLELRKGQVAQIWWCRPQMWVVALFAGTGVGGVVEEVVVDVAFAAVCSVCSDCSVCVVCCICTLRQMRPVKNLSACTRATGARGGLSHITYSLGTGAIGGTA